MQYYNNNFEDLINEMIVKNDKLYITAPEFENS